MFRMSFVASFAIFRVMANLDGDAATRTSLLMRKAMISTLESARARTYLSRLLRNNEREMTEYCIYSGLI